MNSRLLPIFLVLLLIASCVCHVWEFCKIQEFSDNFEIQKQIEVKRTSLMVMYQAILKSLAKQVDILRTNEKKPTLELNFGEAVK